MRTDEVAAAISRYLAENPAASDTADGVRNWWLAGTDVAVADVSAALEQLERVGRLQRIQSSKGVEFRARRL